MCGMKSLTNVKTNFREVLAQEPLTIEEFLKAMNIKPGAQKKTQTSCGMS